MKETIRQSVLFKHLEIIEIETILQRHRYLVRRFGKNQIILLQGDICTSLLLLYQGKAVAGRINNTGKYTVIEEMQAPKLFAPAFLYATENKFPVSVTAMDECEVLIIPRDEFTRILQEESRILFNFLEIVSEQTVFLSHKVKLYGLSLKGKVANFILSCLSQGNYSFELVYTQQKLADIFGVARPSLARILSELEDENLISINKRWVTVHHLKALQELAE